MRLPNFTTADIWALRKGVAESSLYAFLKQAWSSFDPSEFVDGWHLGCMADHLEAVTNGQIRRLIINIPPRHCFDYGQMVQTEHGPQPIGDLVERRVPVRVPSFNEATGQIELKPIVGWHRNPGAEIYELRFSNGFCIRCTGDHRIMVSGGNWLAAADIPIGTPILMVVRQAHAISSLAPVIASPDVVDMRSAKSEPLRKHLSGLGAPADFAGNLRRYLCKRVLETKRGSVRQTIGYILRGCAIAQIAASIVRWISVQMSCFHSSWTWAYEGEHDKGMDRADLGPVLPFAAKTDIQVARAMRSSFQESSSAPIGDAVFPELRVVEASGSPLSGNLVPREAWDLAPDFGRLVWVGKVGHVPATYCLTVRENHNFFAGEREAIVASNCKTNLVAIAWPLWTWIQQTDPAYPLRGPGVRFLCASYGANKAQSDGVTARRLIASKWFQDRWGKHVVIERSRDNQEQYDTTAGGYRISTGIPESLGKGGAVRLWDDPHKVDEVESPNVIASQIRAYDEVWRTRANDPKYGAEVGVMQRLGELDLTGHLLTKDYEDVVHLFLPARYESDRRCVTVIGFEDYRQRDGELLWPQRFDDKWAKQMEESIGSFSWAGQFQQRPEPRGGGILKREWWNIYGPTDPIKDKLKFPAFSFVLACLDTALTEETKNDPSALVLLGVWQDPNTGFQQVMLVFAWRRWRQLHDLAKEVAHTCDKYRIDRLIIENRSIGQPIYDELRRLWGKRDWGMELIEATSRVRGGKEIRANSVTHLFEEGMIHRPNTDWALMVEDECSVFPRGAHDDLVDCVVHGLRWLRDAGILSRKVEQRQKELAMERYSGRSDRKALYPV